jgi:hypothetical protein
MHKYIHVLSGIRTYDPSVRASEDSSCLRPRGHCDRQIYILFALKYNSEIQPQGYVLSMQQISCKNVTYRQLPVLIKKIMTIKSHPRGNIFLRKYLSKEIRII